MTLTPLRSAKPLPDTAIKRGQASSALHYQSLETSNITSPYSDCDYLRLSVYGSPIERGLRQRVEYLLSPSLPVVSLCVLGAWRIGGQSEGDRHGMGVPTRPGPLPARKPTPRQQLTQLRRTEGLSCHRWRRSEVIDYLEWISTICHLTR